MRRRLRSLVVIGCAASLGWALAFDAAAHEEFYAPVGELVPGSGQGAPDETVYAPGMRFPIENGPAYPNSQVWGVGGSQGPGGSQCDQANYSYPWHDNYCETRSWDMPLCPAGVGHQGQDIRPSTCDQSVHDIVSSEAGTVTNIGSYSVYVTAPSGQRFDYLHGDNVAVGSGQSVQKGQPIAKVSNAFGGTPTTIHLHYNIKQDVGGVGFVFVNPYMSLVRSYEDLMGLGNVVPHGPVDAVDCESIRGWAQDPDEPETPIDVHVYFGGPSGDPNATGVVLTADEYRQDLCDALGSCNHGFTLEIPRSLRDGEPHPVHIYGIDTGGGDNPELEASPGQIQCAPPPVPDGVRRVIASPEVLADWQLSTFWDMATVDAAVLDGLPEGEPWPHERLVVAAEGEQTWWVIDTGVRRAVDPEVAAIWNIEEADVMPWPADSVEGIPVGPPLRADKFLVAADGSAIYVLDDAICPPNDPSCDADGSGTGGPDGDGEPRDDDDDAGSSTDTEGPDALPSGQDEGNDGCGCRSSDAGGSGAALLLFGAVLGLRRRRG